MGRSEKVGKNGLEILRGQRTKLLREHVRDILNMFLRHEDRYYAITEEIDYLNSSLKSCGELNP